jgi:oxygen-dependent protoporphyrinogen oxidase
VVVGTFRDKKPAPAKGGASGIFKSMKSGVGTLINALLDRVRVVRQKVEAVAADDDGWRLTVAGEHYKFDSIVVACGANKGAPLLRPLIPELADLLGTIPYTGSAIWTFGYNRSDVPHPLDAFGFLVPKPEREAMMACTWLGTKWAGRVPEDKAVFRCFSTDPDAAREPVQDELHRLMGITAEPIFAIGHRWPDSMPQYTVGHSARVLEIEAITTRIPGLFLAGNAFNGIGIPDCVKSAKLTAEAIGRNA